MQRLDEVNQLSPAVLGSRSIQVLEELPSQQERLYEEVYNYMYFSVSWLWVG